MRALLLGFFVISFSYFSHGQSLVTGTLRDLDTQDPIPFSHVQNLRESLGTLTNREGRFRIPAQIGDTIVFSIVGYKVTGWVIESSHLEEASSFTIERDTILLDELVISGLPPEEVFKQELLSLELEDTSFWYHGVPEPVFSGDKTLDEKRLNNPLFYLSHPITSWHYKFSKKEREKRKMNRIDQAKISANRVSFKFTRDWVEETTSLTGDSLTSFIAFCNYDQEYLDKTPLYLIREDMLVKLELFRKGEKDG